MGSDEGLYFKNKRFGLTVSVNRVLINNFASCSLTFYIKFISLISPFDFITPNV